MPAAVQMTRTDMVPAWVNGVLTPVEKLEVHQRGLKHKAVSVFVLDGENVLIQRRALAKYHTPGLWANTCCTHPLWNEKPAECAVRRLEQELGITGVFPTYRDRLEYRADVGNGLIEHEIVDIYIARANASLEVMPNPDEVCDTKWIRFNDLCTEIKHEPERFTPWLRIYLTDHKDQLFSEILKT